MIFKVITWKFDNIYSTYYGEILAQFENYPDAEKFCQLYEGDEHSIFINKFFDKPINLKPKSINTTN